jgi:hypothetical protein
MAGKNRIRGTVWLPDGMTASEVIWEEQYETVPATPTKLNECLGLRCTVPARARSLLCEPVIHNVE